MNKTLKRILIGILVAALACGGIYGGLIAYRTMNTAPVKVISVADLYDDVTSNAYLFESTNYTTGTVHADRIQGAYISGTLTIKSVDVAVGDKVKKGDVLFTYDTTLTQIQYEKDEVDLEKKRLSLEKKEKILERLKTLSPSSPSDDEGDYVDSEPEEIVESEPEEPIVYEPEETPVLLGGEGTYDDPYLYLWGQDDPLTARSLLQMFAPDGRRIVIPENPDDADLTESEAESQVDPAGQTQSSESKDSSSENAEDYEEDNTHDETPDFYGDYQDDEEEYYTDDDEVYDDEFDASYDYNDDDGDNYDEYVNDENGGNDEPEMPDDPPVSFRIPAGMLRFSEADSEVEYGEGTVSLDELREEVYIILEVHKDDSSEAPVLHTYGLHLFRTDEEVAIRLYNPEGDTGQETGDGWDEVDDVFGLDEEIEGEDDIYSGEDEGTAEEGDDEINDFDDAGEVYDIGGEGTDEEESEDADAATYEGDLIGSEEEFDWDADYTAEDIKEKIEEYTKSVLMAKLDVRKAEIDLKNKKYELENSAKYAALDGEVITVRDPDDAKNANAPLVVVSGGGGYYVTASLGELDIETLELGSQVQVQSYYTNTIYSGTVESVANYPVTGNDYFFGSENVNISYYPAEIKLEKGAEIRDDEFVEVTYSTNSNKGLFIDKRFIRTEGASSYVYAVGDNGLLKKKPVVTGRMIEYSSYIQVRKGLSLEDSIAFPYGNNVYDGAKTVGVSYEEMYEYGEE